MDNSCDIMAIGGFVAQNPGGKSGLLASTAGSPNLSSGITARDGKGRLIQRGAHRDVPPQASTLSSLDGAAAPGRANGQIENLEVQGPQPALDKVFTPMTNF